MKDPVTRLCYVRVKSLCCVVSLCQYSIQITFLRQVPSLTLFCDTSHSMSVIVMYALLLYPGRTDSRNDSLRLVAPPTSVRGSRPSCIRETCIFRVIIPSRLVCRYEICMFVRWGKAALRQYA